MGYFKSVVWVYAIIESYNVNSFVALKDPFLWQILIRPKISFKSDELFIIHGTWKIKTRKISPEIFWNKLALTILYLKYSYECE